LSLPDLDLLAAMSLCLEVQCSAYSREERC
jgi:hypothetical protein